MTATDRTSQLLKGVLEMCLLAVIAEEPSYGYEMVRKLEGRGLALVGEGTIYPLLSRLQRQGLVESFVQESSGGPARKYYRLTENGSARLGDWIEEWRALSDGVDRIIEGGGDD